MEKVGEGNAVALVQFAGAGRCSDVGEALARVVVQQFVRRERAERRIAHAQIEVEVAVVIDVAEVCTHGDENAVEAYLGSDVFKCAVVQVAIEAEGFYRSAALPM